MVSHPRFSRRLRRPAIARWTLVWAICIVAAGPRAASAADNGLGELTVRAFLDGTAPDSVSELLAMQDHVQAVAKQVIPATVAIRVDQAHGSGVIINSEGYVLTAAHVAGAPNRNAQIRMHDGRLVYGTTLGVFRTKDAGLIRITTDGSDWPHASMGNSGGIEGGHWCVATGHPGGFQEGRAPILRLGRILKRERDAITSDCTLIGGDSGGPLFDMRGQVIGIHSRIGEALAQNLHVPVNAYRTTWDRLVAGDAWGTLPGTEEPYEPYIGVQGENQGGRVARVEDVLDGSPAQAAGIQPGDVIVRFGRRRVTTFESLVNLVLEQEPGRSVSVEVLRGEEAVRMDITVGKRLKRTEPR